MATDSAHEPPKRRVLPPVWLLLAIIASAVLDRFLPVVPFDGAWRLFASAAALVIGLAMILVSANAFARVKTGIVPFRPSTELVTGGFYRVTRNPMYLGMALVLTGIGLALGSVGALLPVAAFVAIIDRRFIVGEERMLEAAFGARYLDYRDRVRRWL